MRFAHAISIFVFWLIASLYWNLPLRVCPLTLHDLQASTLEQSNQTLINIKGLENGMFKKTLKQCTFFLVTNPLQAPLVDKWNGDLSRVKRRISIATKSNIQIWCLCRMAHSRSLDKSFDGVRDMETSQTKKRTSSTACLTIVEKNKNKTASKKNTHLWLGFKALNALNESK